MHEISTNFRVDILHTDRILRIYREIYRKIGWDVE